MTPGLHHIYTEELYRISTPLTVVISVPWSQLPENQRQLLSKILQAIQLGIESVRVVHQLTFDLNELPGKPKHIIGFLPPPKGISAYELYRTDQTTIVFADSLDHLLEDQTSKRKLWDALKQLFPT